MGGGIEALVTTVAAIVIVGIGLVVASRANETREIDNRAHAKRSELPVTLGDSRGGCDRKGNDVYACASSEATLRKPAEALWAQASEAIRLSCLRGVSPTYGPVTQIHSCLVARAG